MEPGKEAAPAAEPSEDQRILLGGVSWKDYESVLAMRGERTNVRVYYLDGVIELVSPSTDHELRKTLLARLLEAWAVEVGLDLNGAGSWTLKDESTEAGAEPDECYILGSPEGRVAPDLVIEIEWSRATGLTKHAIYSRLGVRELWTVARSGELVIRSLSAEGARVIPKSAVLPTLDLTWLTSFLDHPSQLAAVRALLADLRAPRH